MRRLLIGLVTVVCALCIAPMFAFADDAASAQAPKKSATVLSTSAGTKTDAAAVLGNNIVYRISTACAAKDTQVIDVNGASTRNGANIIIFKANNGFNQYWRAEYQGNGLYRFISYSGGHYLGVSGKLVSKSNVTNTDKGTLDWQVTKNSDGTFSLSPAGASNVRLDVKGATAKNCTNVWLWTANATKAQKFYFVSQPGLTEAYEVGKSIKAGTVSIVSAADNALSVDIAGASRSNCGNTQLEKISGTPSQKFKLNYRGNGLYEVVNLNSSKVLDVEGRSLKDGANIIQYKSNKQLNQCWYFVPAADGGFRIKTALNGYTLNAASLKAKSNIRVSKSSNQTYVVEASQLVSDGVYVITSSMLSPFVLDVANNSTADKANLIIWRSNGGENEKFKITHIGNDVYTIMGIQSGNYISVAGSSNKKGANIQMSKNATSDASKWRIEIGPTGLMFKSVASGLYLDVYNANKKRGTNVIQWSKNGNKNQCWNLNDENWRFYPTNTSIRDMQIIIKAEQYEGWRYRWGGRSPVTSFDCAGLVMYCSNQVWGTNFDLMYTNAAMLYDKCQKISAKDAKVGDLVFYRGTYNNIDYISHVVIYAGNGVMYGAGDPIGYDNVDAIKNMRKQPAKYMFARIRH